MPREIQTGDPVTWTETSGTFGGTFNFKSKEGKVLEIEGSTAVVQYKNGRKTHVSLSNLRHADDRNHLTELFLGPADADKPKDPEDVARSVVSYLAGENKCHFCGVPTEGECAFDRDMNPYIDPKPCCGEHGCAEDV